ncbi:SunI/YnzG family protein [Metabacillus sp. B2-18]|uniref:SunI/YnzG family protein n=1 Tax=Metabacillus sp. B2-18 TaxID=2897333 RepID=UPI001E330E66|nr:hypothetical protein [Metabacillus sp. B2-18]UGB33110.1 hypothetical protein LPC09_12130 [Metabacillus sp. B2-18]
MLGLNIKKSNNIVSIKWQLTKVEIPTSEIIDVSEEKEAIRIGTPYGTTDRVVIKTTKKTYILYTTNPTSIKNKILS